MSKLIRWETPFTDIQRPSVGLIIASDHEDSGDSLKAIVAPHGTVRYPKYLVDFGDVVAFTCMEESHSPRNDFEVTDGTADGCAYLFPNSPWLISYDPWRYFFRGSTHDRFFHYLIFGGDNNIEVISPDVPTFRTIEQREVLRLEYEI
jgi:hypothetical protein